LGITKIDLSAHFNKEELVEYSKANQLPITGNKRDLIARILAHVEGREIPLPKGKKRRKKKTSETEKKSDDNKKRARELSSGESPQKKKNVAKRKKSDSSSSSEGSVKTPKKINK